MALYVAPALTRVAGPGTDVRGGSARTVTVDPPDQPGARIT